MQSPIDYSYPDKLFCPACVGRAMRALVPYARIARPTVDGREKLGKNKTFLHSYKIKWDTKLKFSGFIHSFFYTSWLSTIRN